MTAATQAQAARKDARKLERLSNETSEPVLQFRVLPSLPYARRMLAVAGLFVHIGGKFFFFADMSRIPRGVFLMSEMYRLLTS